jgi:hypothetical protein
MSRSLCFIALTKPIIPHLEEVFNAIGFTVIIPQIKVVIIQSEAVC